MESLKEALKEATASLEAALPGLKWESADVHGTMTHFTGRGAEWRVELVVLGRERMGTGVRGPLILKLTEAQAEQAEVLARRP